MTIVLALLLAPELDPDTPEIVICVPLVYGMLALIVITIGEAFDNATMFATIVVFGVQDKLPRPSVCNTKPVDPPIMLIFATLPNCNLEPFNKAEFPVQLSHVFVLDTYVNVWPLTGVVTLKFVPPDPST